MKWKYSNLRLCLTKVMTLRNLTLLNWANVWLNNVKNCELINQPNWQLQDLLYDGFPVENCYTRNALLELSLLTTLTETKQIKQNLPPIHRHSMIVDTWNWSIQSDQILMLLWTIVAAHTLQPVWLVTPYIDYMW